MKTKIHGLMTFVIVAVLFFASMTWAADKLLFSGDSPYTGIEVYDKDDGLRYLQFGVYEQTVMRVADPEYIHYSYLRSMLAGFAFVKKTPEKILSLGLGGGTMARYIALKFPDAQLDNIEIDPLVVDVAEKYFGYKPGDHGRIFVGDGRRLLRKSTERYDVIILDAYKAGGIPFHLTTREFMQLVKDHLTPDGVVIIHLWAEYANEYLHAQVKTIADVFPRNYSFYDDAGSFIIFATLHDDWLSKEAVRARGAKISESQGFGFDLGALIDKQYVAASQIPTEGLVGQILTDDFAPVNLLRHQSGR